MDPTDEIVRQYGVDPRYANHVPLGWERPVRWALGAIRAVDPSATVWQVKTKWGGLRIYAVAGWGWWDLALWRLPMWLVCRMGGLPRDHRQRWIDEIVARAERRCEVTCPACGVSPKTGHKCPRPDLPR